MLKYIIGLTKPTKAYPEKFSVTLNFSTEEEFADAYRHFRKLNLDARYSKTKFSFFLPVTMESVIGLIRLRQEFTLDFSAEAHTKFDCLRDQAIAEIELRQHETEIVSYLKQITNKRINLKHYQSKTTMYHHQKVLFALATKVRKSFIMSDPGTGKTLAAISAMDYRIQKGEVKKVVVIVPGHLLFKWAESPECELTKHSNRKGKVLIGDKKKRLEIIRRFNNDPKVHFLITSYSFWSGRQTNEGNRNDDEYRLLTDGPINAYVCDESHKLKNYKANATRNVIKWLSPMPYGTLLTGTPSPNSVLDFFTQYRLVDSSVFGNDYYNFLKKYFKQGNSFGGDWKPKSDRHREAVLTKSKKKGISYRTDECLDLPLAVDEIIKIPASEGYLTELYNLSPSHIQDLMDAGVKANGVLSKLLIASNGYTYLTDAEGNRTVHEFSTNPKLDALEDICVSIADANQKGIIWTLWQYDEVIIRRMLDRLKYKYMVINRFDCPEDRIKKCVEFDADPSYQFMITSPKILAQGVDILSPAYAIFFSVNFEMEQIIQAKARNRRLGSDKFHKTIFYYTLVLKDSVEEDVVLSLRDKKSLKDAIFGAAQNIINKIRKFKARK